MPRRGRDDPHGVVIEVLGKLLPNTIIIEGAIGKIGISLEITRHGVNEFECTYDV
jgi:hypothetical protein